MALRPYGTRWQRARAEFLRLNPLCVRHLELGQVVASTVVDHIKPHGMARGVKATPEQSRLFWSTSNWQALCEQCHNSYKQRLEKTGTVAGCTADGMPLDPSHHWARGRQVRG